MTTSLYELEAHDLEVLPLIFGPLNKHKDMIEAEFSVVLNALPEGIEIQGAEQDRLLAERLLAQLAVAAHRQFVIGETDIRSACRLISADPKCDLLSLVFAPITLSQCGYQFRPRNAAQKGYIECIERNDLIFGLGPAGTGKTYLATVMASDALLKKKVKRIILTRPAVEAGEKLGFLPGDLEEKVDPYLRPFYDALYDVMNPAKVSQLMADGAIEIAPLAFMRGRTLHDSYVLLDEAQNTTVEQMLMLLTRLGENTKAVITGDVTQTDLPHHVRSGLLEATERLAGIQGIETFEFSSSDIVRSELVLKIVKAFEGAR